MEIFAILTAGPVLPATLLLALLACWSLLAVIGAADFNLSSPDADVDLGSPVDSASPAEAVSGLGIATLRWLNLSQIPIMIWMGIFTILFWLVSVNAWIFIDSHFFSPTNWLWAGVLVCRNVILTAPLTKLATKPMLGWFTSERLTSQSLVGQECEISSHEASPEYGQVKFKTDGSPLLLNVRTDGPHLAKGARVWITHYDQVRRIYIVSPTTSLGPSVSHSSSTERE